MKILYHCLSQVIDFLFPKQEEIFDVKTFPENVVDLGFGITALFSYQDEKVKQAIWQIKYYRNEKVTRDVTGSLFEKIISLRLPTPFIIVPIPMSDTSRKQRGYNQTEFLAEKLFTLLGNEMCAGISYDLQKIHTSRPQHTLERSERIKNALGMFWLREKDCFSGKNVLILDDVVTTGSTVKEVSKVLLGSGAKSVNTIVIAH